ncbi:hypothetical protein M5K25_026641 [Dendrobium thyrsiflorum]|uniref:Uncharacterized protein n=1 Tax=Dendrobium thyrsiflorum TaxID=117978 RepID=A0ABD0TY09_DENTH
MADPEVDHGFVDDANERTDILRSPFFDPYPGWDLTVDGYINRISYQLACSIEEHLPSGHWTIVGRTTLTASFTITKGHRCHLPRINLIPCMVLLPPPTLDIGEWLLDLKVSGPFC